MGDQKSSCELLCSMFNKVKPYLAMISLQFGYAGMYIITILCMKRGMSHYVLAVYRHAVATLAIAPFALAFERKIRPKMTLSIFLKIMVLGFLEPVLDQNLYYVGMNYTSATFSSAIFNALPAITFIMAVIFKLERVKIKKLHSLAKVIGTTVTISGAMVMTLYKGPILNFVRSQGQRNHHNTSSSGSTDQHWVIGTIMLIASCSGWAGFFVLQSFTLKSYPAELSLTTLICFMGMVQGAVVALVMEHDFNTWALGWDSRLLGPVYTGIVCSGMAYYMQGMVIKERGPVFVTAFSPLCMIVVAALGSLILAEQIHLGSVIGAIIIVVGLYCVVWGKSKDDYAISSPLTGEKGEAFELPTAMINGSEAIDVVDSNSKGGILMSETPSIVIPKSYK
ncbi:WAT1-related protein At1g44800 isoform X1 [Telopea speciosissima]|uniref:WAT1-related protein At1g44800 isoform X1 n=1 Tax=Telopea speciosissima TaxID=54955 RepID=UPI001CC3D948|nr:WAT1-related protein At1g44800 isoform X1 [Telopea speciosissima]XP_043712234.1 WAT1-related protein At1g44800 isoform X1 [Telopea speciosissima]